MKGGGEGKGEEDGGMEWYGGTGVTDAGGEGGGEGYALVL